MTVFAVQQQRVKEGFSYKERFDFSSAEERFGPVRILLGEEANPHDLKPVLSALHSQLCSIKEDDWLILTGNPILIGLTVAIAADYLDGIVRVLQWSGQHNCYIPITVENLYGEEQAA